MTTRLDKPWSHDIPDGPWDYIVIGTGMGGMTAAGVLSKVGKRVLVIERHNIPGGFTQTFKRPGYKWDVGVHIIGEMTERSYPGRLLKDLTNGELEWEPVGEIYDEFNFPDGFTIQFPDSSEAFRETLKDYFPQESSGIDHYMELVKRAARASAKYFQMRAMPSMLAPGGLKKAKAGALPHLTATTSEVLESIIDDPRLRAVLAAQWGYYGATPKRSSFAMHALMVRHFMYGAYFPVGGAGSIARTMLATVAGAGGWTAVRHSVDEIIVRNGKVQGVRLGNGTEVAARRVISAAGAVPTARMLGEDLPGSPSPYREAGPAHVSLYLGFKGDIERAGAHRYCRWYYDSWDMEVPGSDVHPDRIPGHAPVLFTSFPSLKDPAHDAGPELRHTGEAITFVLWDSFEAWEGTRWKKRGESYDAFKSTLTDALLKQYLDVYPGLASLVDHVELSTPLSTAHFTDAVRGSIYGLNTEPDRFLDDSLGPKTPIKGLFLGGQDASAPGVVGALGGGALAAMAAEPIAVGRYITPLMRTPRP